MTALPRAQVSTQLPAMPLMQYRSPDPAAMIGATALAEGVESLQIGNMRKEGGRNPLVRTQAARIGASKPGLNDPLTKKESRETLLPGAGLMSPAIKAQTAMESL